MNAVRVSQSLLLGGLLNVDFNEVECLWSKLKFLCFFQA